MPNMLHLLYIIILNLNIYFVVNCKEQFASKVYCKLQLIIKKL
jgi:hypothetical protein